MGSRLRAQSPSSVNKTSQWQLAWVFRHAHSTPRCGYKRRARANSQQFFAEEPRLCAPVCARSLTGGNAYLRRPRGQLHASASVPRVPSDREKNSWQWDVSGEPNKSTWASPKLLQISWSTSGWSRHSPGRAGWCESSSAARLCSPGTWTARSDLRCFWLQRRRWQASFDMRRERRPPWWLMYATVTVLSVQTSTCFSCSSVLKRRRASHTASN